MAWTQVGKCHYVTEASDLDMRPGKTPNAHTFTDPWDREGKHHNWAGMDFRTSGPDTVIGWSCLVNDPDGNEFRLTIFND